MTINIKMVGFYFLVFLFALIVFLLVGLPAKVLWGVIKDQGVVPPSVQVKEVRGTVWNGKASAVYNQIPLGTMNLEWNMKPFQLLMAKLALDIDLKADNANLLGEVSLGFGRVSLSEMKGRVQPSLINTVGRQFKTRIDAPIDLNIGSLTIHTSEPKRVRDAQGKLNWNGGNVQYSIAGRRQSSSFPPMTGTLSQQGEEAQLVIVDPAKKEVISSRIGDDGWAKLEIRKHLVDLSGQPWPNSVNPEEVIFEVQEKVF